MVIETSCANNNNNSNNNRCGTNLYHKIKHPIKTPLIVTHVAQLIKFTIELKVWTSLIQYIFFAVLKL